MTPGGGSNEPPPSPKGRPHDDPSRPFLPDAWRILLPYWRSEDRRAARGLLAAIGALNLGAVYVRVQLNTWNRAFYDALQQRDFSAFTHELVHFCRLAGLFIVTAVYRQYLTQTLEMRWRRWLTDEFLGRWLGDRAYPESALFLPQRSYLPIASLREAIAYPSDPRAFGDGAIMVALRRCKLERVILGELRTHLAGTTIVSIAHRPSVAAYHERRVELARVGDVVRLRESGREPRGIGLERQAQGIREERDRVVEARQHDQLE